jgi:hypothetical protein
MHQVALDLLGINSELSSMCHSIAQLMWCLHLLLVAVRIQEK